MEPKIGDLILPDGWTIPHRLEESDWEKAKFRLPTGQSVGVLSLAVNVEVSGKSEKRMFGEWGWIRVKLEFVGDGEPSKIHYGYWQNRGKI